MIDPETKAATCAVQHIAAYKDQMNREEIADLSEPCRTCPLLMMGECKLDRFLAAKPLLEKSLVKSFHLLLRGYEQ